MTKQELIDFIVADTGFDKADVMVMFDSVLVGITSGLKKEGKVTINGFCNFSLKEKAAAALIPTPNPTAIAVSNN